MARPAQSCAGPWELTSIPGRALRGVFQLGGGPCPRDPVLPELPWEQAAGGLGDTFCGRPEDKVVGGPQPLMGHGRPHLGAGVRSAPTLGRALSPLEPR